MNRTYSGRGNFRAVLVSCTIALAAAPALAEHPGMPGGEPATANLHRGPADAVMKPAQVAGQGAPLFVEAGSMRRIQAALKRAGFDAGAVDGVYGRKTGKALCEFQKARGLEPTGGVTLGTMHRLGVAPESAGKAEGEGANGLSVPLMVSRAAIRQVQQAMAEAREGWVGVDGMWTTTFSNALRHWQAARGLEPTGTITVETLAMVGGDGDPATVEISEAGSDSTPEDIEVADAGAHAATATDASEPAAAKAQNYARVNCDAAAAYDDPYVGQLYLAPAAVRRIERTLGREGFEPGRTDGVFDTLTSYGLVRFQKAEGIEPTGTLTLRTVGALGFAKALQGAGS